MCPEYLDFFEDSESPAPGAATSFRENSLFDASHLDRELPRSKAWKSAAVPPDLRSLLSSLCTVPDPARLGFEVEAGEPASILTVKGGAAHIAFLAVDAIASNYAIILNAMAGTGADWGLITDGGAWRLYSASFADPTRYYEVDLPLLLKSEDDNDLKYFFLIMGAAGYKSAPGRKQGFARAALNATLARRAAFENELGEAALMAAAALCRGFISAEQHTTGARPAGQGLLMIYRHSVLLLQRMLYLLFAEARGALPMSDARYEEASFTRFASAAAHVRIRKTPSYALWPRLTEIFEQTWRGHKLSSAAPQTSEFFNPDMHKFLQWNKVDDAHLSRAASVLLPLAGGMKQADAHSFARALAPLCRGSLALAAKKMVLIREDGGLAWLPAAKVKWKEVIERIAPGGAYIESAPAAAAAQKQSAPHDVARAIIKTGRVFDPACGAGLTLLAAAERLTLLIARDNPKMPLHEHKRATAMKYLYGADTNHLAAELARFVITLWALSPTEPPVNIEHRIREGNIIHGVRISDLAENAFQESPVVLDKIKDQLAELAGDIAKLEAMEANTYGQGRHRQSSAARIRRRTDDLAYAADLYAAAKAGDTAASAKLQNMAGGRSTANPRTHESFLADPRDTTHPLHLEWAFPDVVKDTKGFLVVIQ